jgi:hypothetical protein
MIGDISEVKNFLNPGYSYKVEKIIGKINADGSVTYGNTMCQAGYSRANSSLVVWKKAFQSTEWEVSFGWYAGRDAETATATYVGMEIISGADIDKSALGSNTAARANYQPDKFNTISLELDNVAIYGGRNKTDADVVTFDNIADEDFYLNDEEGITMYIGGYSSPLGQCFGHNPSGWDENHFTVEYPHYFCLNFASIIGANRQCNCPSSVAGVHGGCRYALRLVCRGRGNGNKPARVRMLWYCGGKCACSGACFCKRGWGEKTDILLPARNSGSCSAKCSGALSICRACREDNFSQIDRGRVDGVDRAYQSLFAKCLHLVLCTNPLRLFDGAGETAIRRPFHACGGSGENGVVYRLAEKSANFRLRACLCNEYRIRSDGGFKFYF